MDSFGFTRVFAVIDLLPAWQKQLQKFSVAWICVSLIACATDNGSARSPDDSMQDIPGDTLGDSILQRDTLHLLRKTDAMVSGLRCRDQKVVNTEVIEAPERAWIGNVYPGQLRWAERWTVDSCGKQVPYRVDYKSADDGGIDFSIRLER